MAFLKNALWLFSFLRETKWLSSVDNAWMRSCMKTHRILPLTSICHPLNRRLCSPKAYKNSTVLVLPPLAVLFWRQQPPHGLFCTKAQTIHGGFNPAASDCTPCRCCDFYVAGIVSPSCAPLASAEWTPVPRLAGGRVRTVQQLFHKRFILWIKINK